MFDVGISGVMKDSTHCLPLRVYYSDTDAGGVVYHAAYLVFAERARGEMMRAIGVDLLALKEEKQLAFAVHRCEMDFIRPARLDDLLEVRSVLRDMGGSTLIVDQSVWLGEVELVRMKLRLVCMCLNAPRAKRIPQSLRAQLQDFVKETE